MSSQWPLVSLGDLLRLERRPVVLDAEQLYPEIGIYCFGKGIFHKLPRNGFEVGDKDLFALKKDDFILQVTFAWEGAVAVVSEKEEGMYGSTRYPTFRVDERRCIPQFLQLYFRTYEGLQQLIKISPGSAGRNRVLSMKRVPEVMVPLPPVPVQRRLVSRIEALAALVSEAKGLCKEVGEEVGVLYSLALGEQMLSHGTGWIQEKLGDVIVSMDAGWSPQCDEIPATGDQWGVLKTTAVQWCRFDSVQNKVLPSTLQPRPDLAVQEGDVLITRAGPRKRVGVVAAVRKSEPRLMISDKIIRIRPVMKKIEPRFLELSIASPFSQEHLVSRKTGLADAQVNISQAILKAMPIAYPALPTQRRIVQELDALQTEVEALRKLQAATAAELDALMGAVLGEVFGQQQNKRYPEPSGGLRMAAEP